MKVLIQHNFTCGLGDFVSDMSQYMELCSEWKKLGYEINLRISLEKNAFIDCSFFYEIFDVETINFFDTVEESVSSIKNLEYQEYFYHTSSHFPYTPGVHHWDVFFDVPPPVFNIINYDATKLVYNNLIPSFLPKFKNEIIEISDSFVKKINEEYSFLHVRIFDGDSDISRVTNIIDRINSYVLENKVKIHIGSNNSLISKSFENTQNVYTFDFNNFEKYNNEMSFFKFFGQSLKKSEKSKILMDRMKLHFAEMISIKESRTIIIFNDYNWISNFLFYSLALNKCQQKILQFDNKHGGIESVDIINKTS